MCRKVAISSLLLFVLTRVSYVNDDVSRLETTVKAGGRNVFSGLICTLDLGRLLCAFSPRLFRQGGDGPRLARRLVHHRHPGREGLVLRLLQSDKRCGSHVSAGRFHRVHELGGAGLSRRTSDMCRPTLSSTSFPTVSTFSICVGRNGELRIRRSSICEAVFQ